MLVTPSPQHTSPLLWNPVWTDVTKSFRCSSRRTNIGTYWTPRSCPHILPHLSTGIRVSWGFFFQLHLLQFLDTIRQWDFSSDRNESKKVLPLLSHVGWTSFWSAGTCISPHFPASVWCLQETLWDPHILSASKAATGIPLTLLPSICLQPAGCWRN